MAVSPLISQLSFARHRRTCATYRLDQSPCRSPVSVARVTLSALVFFAGRRRRVVHSSARYQSIYILVVALGPPLHGALESFLIVKRARGTVPAERKAAPRLVLK